MAFTAFNPLSGSLDALVQGLLAANSGIAVDAGSISLHLSGVGAVSLYDDAVGTPLGITAGVLLTSGITPGTSNTSTWYGADNSGSSGFSNGDADINAVVNTVFQTTSYDATSLAFSFSLGDPQASSISFDLVFGSDEYPEWVDAFVDCAVVIVDGVNYALFNKDPNAPLSVISPNLAAGYFQNNANGAIPIEYDGVSGLLRIVAPLKSGQSQHTIKIAIADTGDHILDSGLFIANMSAGRDPGSGVVSNPDCGSSDNDNCSGSSKDEYFDLLEGDDTVYAGGGADIIVAGAGNDVVVAGSGKDDLKGDGGDDHLDGGSELDTAFFAGAHTAYTISYDPNAGTYSINGSSQGEGVDTLLNVEQLAFSDGVFTLANDGVNATLTAVTAPPPNPPANSPGLVLVSGLAAVGQTLKATLADADGVPAAAAAISWQWYSDSGAIVGATASTYTVQATDSDQSVWVKASYADGQGHSEQPSSTSLFIKPLFTDGELTATLMAIDGPEAAHVHTPITTLLLRAVELGETPNGALQKIRTALDVPAQVPSLLSMNAFEILQSGVGDTGTALKLARLEVQVAVLCSVSDDQDGLKLTLALLEQGANDASFDLTDAADVATILGIATDGLDFDDPDTWPKTLQEIVDRTNNLSEAGRLLESSSGTGKSLEKEWLDFLSNWDELADNVPLASLSQAINQGPTGFASAELPSLMAGEEDSFLLTSAQLSEGFVDPDGDVLAVTSLATDKGAWFTSDGQGNWVLDPGAAGYDPTYLGPLELSYVVDDGHGHEAAASQLVLVVGHLNHSPEGSVTITGTPQQGQVLTAAHTLADADGLGSITYQWMANASAIGGATADTFKLTQAEVGKTITVSASYTDGFGTSESVSSAATTAVAPPPGDTAAPIVTGASLSGTVVTLAFSEAISATGLPITAFQVASISATGAATAIAINSTAAVSGDPSRLVLNLKSAPAAGSSLRIAYTDPANNQTTGVVQDGAGNDMASILTTAPVYATALNSGSTVSSLGSRYITLTLTGTAAINGTGNSNDNTIHGNSANNLLNGGLGGDTMAGGGGNDTYVVDSTADRIIESANSGTDLVQASVSYSLADLPAIEDLTLTGTAATTGTGNSLNNLITGNSAANMITGQDGNDTLAGGAGTDTLTGGGGVDTFRFDTTPGSSNRDLITDFASGTDKLLFSKTVYAGFSSSAKTITSSQLRTGDGVATAITTTQRFLYDSSAGILRYDRDGSGTTYGALDVAILAGNPLLNASDFVLA